MGETYLHVTSPEVYSKRFSDYVKQFHADDSDDAKNDEKKQKVKNQQVKRESRGKRVPRRMSESSLLPPINVKPDVSTPVFTNGVWTFRGTTNKTTTPHVGGVGIRRVDHPKESLDKTTPRKEHVRSFKTLTTSTSLTVSKSPETTRLSPIVPSDKKMKTDKKTSSKPSNENTPRLVSKPTSDNHRTKVKGHKNSKYKQLEEPFSIRRKIEQFKRYHEEQYLMKLQKLKQDSEIKIELSKRKPSPEKVKIIDKIVPRVENEAVTSGDEDSGNESAFNLSTIMKSTTSRHKSAKTWRTWRDVNDSYAYTDVRKYIEDNELMTPEKADWIKHWTLEVDRAFFSAE